MSENQNRMRIFTHPLFAILIILLSCIAVYSSSIRGTFIFDDANSIVGNPIIKNLEYFVSPSKAAGLEKYGDLYRRYAGYLSFAINYKIHGLSATGYHITNVLIHFTSALFVFFLILLTLRTPFMRTSSLRPYGPFLGLFAGVAFAVHPVQTQAISYIVQRFASLATMFYLASLVFYIQARLSKTKVRNLVFYGLCLMSAVLGMKTKEIVFTLPITALLYDFFFFDDISIRRRLFRWLPLGLTMFIIPLSLLDFGGLSTNLVKSLDESTRAKTTLAMSRKTYFLTEMRVIVTYLRLLIFPVNQTLDYDYPMNKVFFQLPVSASFAILCGLAALGVVFFRRSKAGRPEQRVLSFGICWFFITLSVESTFVPLFVIFEHRLYLPSAGVITGLAFGTFMILDAVRNRRAKAALVIFMVAWPLVLGCAAFSRNRTWNGEISIWEDVIAKAPNKARGYASLGRAYQEIGENSRAQELYQEALDLQKRSGSSLAGEKKENEVLSVTYLYIGNNYYAQGDAALAMQNYEQAISADKNNAIAYYNLGIVYLNDGLTGKAIEQVETSIAINPGFAQAHFIKGEALLEDSRIDEAIDSYRRAVSLDPELGQAWQGMARAFGRKKDFDQATRYYRKASELMPDVSDVQYQFGNALKEAGNMKAAQAAWKRTVELDPKNSGALNQLGVYYLTEGDEERAVKYLERSLKYRELNAEAHYNLAVALERLGRLEEAVAHYERFIQVASPGYADVVILAQERVRQLGGTSPSDN